MLRKLPCSWVPHLCCVWHAHELRPCVLLLYLFRRQDDVWRESALRKLPVLMGATDMLVCGEDLGFVPTCVPPIMQVRGWGIECQYVRD